MWKKGRDKGAVSDEGKELKRKGHGNGKIKEGEEARREPAIGRKWPGPGQGISFRQV